VSTNGLVDTKQQPGVANGRQYSEALKRQMVAETLVPGHRYRSWRGAMM
jgi:transposase-like protein